MEVFCHCAVDEERASTQDLAEFWSVFGGPCLDYRREGVFTTDFRVDTCSCLGACEVPDFGH